MQYKPYYVFSVLLGLLLGLIAKLSGVVGVRLIRLSEIGYTVKIKYR